LSLPVALLSQAKDKFLYLPSSETRTEDNNKRGVKDFNALITACFFVIFTLRTRHFSHKYFRYEQMSVVLL
jgi:hypothetical protein